MADFVKNKVVTALVVVATIILAGVAIFTALRLYQLRQESITPTAPESEPAAWDCKNYTFSVSGNGIVTITNNSTRDEPPQQAKVYINSSLVATFDVPAVPKGGSATLGTVKVPNGQFSWRVVGTLDCSSEGTSVGEPIACELLKFTVSQETSPTPTQEVTPTLTPTVTDTPGPTSTSTPTPTDRPIGGTSPTPTQEPGPTSTSTPTPTRTEIAAVSPTPGGAALPDAGLGSITIFGFGLGFLLLILALLLAV